VSNIQAFSSGGGTQSSCIAAMICLGDLPKPDYAAIVDTHYEADSTWRYMDEFVYPALKSVGVELVRVPSKEYATVGLYGGKNKDTLLIPAWTTESGEVGKLPTLCSNEWKVRVFQRWLRENGVKGADIWIGYSIDEKKRIRAQQGPWQHRWPLIEKRLRRQDSINYVERMGWPTPPRSACWMCPNMNDLERKEQKENEPEDFKKAVLFEKAIQKEDDCVWLTQRAIPLDEIDYNEESDQTDLFESHCPNTGCFT
jgi:hypothetical protein